MPLKIFLKLLDFVIRLVSDILYAVRTSSIRYRSTYTRDTLKLFCCVRNSTKPISPCSDIEKMMMMTFWLCNDNESATTGARCLTSESQFLIVRILSPSFSIKATMITRKVMKASRTTRMNN